MNPPTESSLRKRTNTTATDFKYEVIPCKRLRNLDYSAILPDEILLHIFSFLNNEELYRIARCVCKRWYLLTSSPVLWKKITAKGEVPSKVLCDWLKHSPLLKELILEERDDINMIAQVASKFSKNLQSLKVENTRAKRKMPTVLSKSLCRLLTSCKYLNNLHFSGVKIYSCKFFKLLSKRKHLGVNKKCSYFGPVNQKQMKVLIEAIVSSDTYDNATLFTSNRSISIKENSNDNPDVPNIENIWQDITNRDYDDIVDELDENYNPEDYFVQAR
ncbi:uncharacterized protein [Leptinotarsa decemlineata]|uniref:uncharacterized protein n=1 Tax=Leptinotarsa decemlineata TaxID=7539 RepID=UPI003D304AB0